MILLLQRFKRDAKTTIGKLDINGYFECFILEDAERCEKINGQTAIPKGSYQIKFREEDTPLTKRYQDRFDWFTYHLQILGILNFKWVYIHIGNTELDTEGCLLTGDTAVSDPSQNRSTIQQSTQAFERVYKQLSDALKKEEVWITVE